MIALLFIIVAFLITAAVLGPIFYLHSRRVLREQKNYERGLKMVPLLIHLPPSSEDKEVGQRDEREINDENISKAQILYTIIASTLQKGLRSKFYGQRHFAFEIIATYGFVRFYAAVPVSMVDVVTQAVISAYPSARLEEVAEHNVFSPVGKITGTVGGELSLKEHFAYPIATYQDLKRDPVQSLLNALSSLDKEDGVGIQILLRPADPGWRKKASTVASKKRKGKEKKSFGPQAMEFAQAFWKPPEGKDEGKSPEKDLSNLDQSILDAIDDKTRHAGYETSIRIVASSNVSQRAQTVLNNVVAAFAVFNAQGKNGFKYTPSKDIEQFVTAFILRFFPQENNQNVLNAVELASIFHFPDQKNIPTSQLERQASKQVDAPRNIPNEGLFMGYNVFRGVKKAIRLALLDRQRHMYVVGQTGTGKSTFLENLAFQDMISGNGFAFIDPHGDVAERLLAMVPKERTEDVIYFCPADMDYPMGLNMFEFHSEEQKDFLIQEAINMLYKLYDPQRQGIIGPRYEHWFRNAALTVMANPEGGTFIDIPKVFTDKGYEKMLKEHVKDQTVLDFWNKEMASTSDYHKSEVLGWFVSKFGAFLSNEMMRNIIGQTKSAFNLRDIMDNKKILIVNLSKGRTGELNSKLLGMIFVMKFQAAAMSRADVPEEQRTDFCLYVDEFQNFSTDSFATIMSEARKYHLNLIVANQFTTQLTDEVRDAVFGNMGTIVSFRVGQNDVDVLSKYFQPLFEPEDLLRVPNHNAIVRTLVSGVPTQSFSMSTVPPLGNPNYKLGEALKQLSAAKFGKPKAQVEAKIFGRLATKEEPKPALGAPGGPTSAARSPLPPRAAQPARRPAAPGSFLDEWLAKRRMAPAAPMAPRRPYPPQMPPQAQYASPPVVPTANMPYNPQPISGHAQAPLSAPSAYPAPQAPPRQYPAQPLPPAPAASMGQPASGPNPAIDLNKTNANVQYGSTAKPPVASPTQFDNEEVAKVAQKLQGKPADKTSGEVSLRSEGSNSSEDTIFIDNDGMLHQKGEDQPAPTSSSTS